MKYERHELSMAWPDMDDSDFQALKDSIDAIGVQNPVTLFEGQVLDGWHRYRAAQELGVDCPVVDLGDNDPQDFVFSQNRARRHISQAQIAVAVSATYAWRPGGRPSKPCTGCSVKNDSNLEKGCTGCTPENDSKLSSPEPTSIPEMIANDGFDPYNQPSGRLSEPGKTTKELAKIAGTSKRSIHQAKAVLSKGSPELVDAVKSGKVGLKKAESVAKLPKEEQAAALDKPIAKKPAPAPQEEPQEEAAEPQEEGYDDEDDGEPEYSELDAANDRAEDLARQVVVLMAGGTEADRSFMDEMLADLQKEVRTLRAHLKAVTLTRDSLMGERAEMMRQMAYQRKQIEKLKKF